MDDQKSFVSGDAAEIKDDLAPGEACPEILSAALGSIAEGVIVCEPAGRVLYLNAAAETLTGWSAGGAAGKPVEEVFRILDAQSRTPAGSPLRSAVCQGAPVVIGEEIRLVSPQGEERRIAGHCVPIRSRSGEIHGAAAVFRDVTEEAGQREELERSEKRYRTLVEEARIPIVVARNGRFIYANPAATRVLKASPEEVLDRPVTDFIHPDDWHLVLSRHQARIEGKDVPARYEFRVVNRAGEVIWMTIDAVRIHWDGEPATFSFLEDVTARKQAEEELRHSERRFLSVMHASEDAILLLDDAGIVDCNVAAARMLGYATREEFLAAHTSPASFSPPVQPDGRPSGEKAAEMICLAFERGFHRFEWVHRRANGEDFPAEISLTPILYEGRKVLYCVGRDITRQKRNEEERRRNEERLKEAERMARLGNWELDLVTNRLIWSDEVYRIFEIDPAEFGASYEAFLDAVHPEDREVVNQAYLFSLETQTEYEIEHRLLMPDGRIKYVHEHCKTFYDAQGRPLRSVGTVQDITERKRTEQELLKSLEQVHLFRTLIESSGDCFYMLDLDEAGRICYVNEAAVRHFGVPREVIYTRRMADWDPDSDPDRHLELLIEACDKGESLHLTGRHLLADGSMAPVEVTANFLKTAEGRRYAYGWFRNIRDRLAAEEELRRAKEAAEAASRAKSQFLANMSHEIRTPMNAVIGMTGLLLDTALTEEQRRYAEIIRSSAESLLALLNDILDLSKIEVGKLELETIEFDLGALMDDFASGLALRAHERGLEFLCDVDPDVPVLLRGDPVRLRQVLVNLTGNAIKFTHRGEVAVRVSRAGVEEKENLCRLRFSVRDTGIGIPADKIGILFDKFTQVDASISRQYGGTGLGLAISKQLVEMMGGEIGVHSEPGKGSEFWFTARFAPQSGAEPAKPAAPTDLRGVRALIVDDNATSREILTRRLSGWGLRPTAAEDGPSALNLLWRGIDEGDPFRLALIDMQMPGMDGLSLGRAIQADARLKDVRMVLLTSLGTGGGQALAEIGFAGYLNKPVRQEELRGVLAQALGGRTPAEPPGAARQSERDVLPSFTDRKARILLVEDNRTNQEVVLGMLSKLSLGADVVSGGREALDALVRSTYDLVLMDVQMPGMDGLETTRRIRSQESAKKGLSAVRRLPIIAMTAHAMQGDREKCLEAGMDDYLSKPVNLRELAYLLDKWLPKRTGTEEPEPKAESRAVEPAAPHATLVWDRTGMLDRFLGDEELAASIVEDFLTDVPRQIKALRAALETCDAEGAAREAHAIKGAAANVGGERLRALAFEMELAARAGDVERVKMRLGELVAAVDEFRRAVHPVSRWS